MVTEIETEVCAEMGTEAARGPADTTVHCPQGGSGRDLIGTVNANASASAAEFQILAAAGTGPDSGARTANARVES